MAISCPFCRDIVEIRPEVGGRLAKCPSCLTAFDPHAPNEDTSGQQSASPTSPVAGNVTIADVERMLGRVQHLTAQEAPLQAEIARCGRSIEQLTTLLLFLRAVLRARRMSDHSVSRIGAALILVTVGACAFVIVANMLGASVAFQFVIAVLGLLLSAAIMLIVMFFPQDRSIEEQLTAKTERLSMVVKERTGLEARLTQCHAQLTKVQAEHDRMKRAIESRLHWLRTCRWPSMTGEYFEKFLFEVFTERGYAVERTGKSGDQGIDLVVEKNGFRVAVQAKGYTSGNVGNSAVQEAHTGMTHYRCHKSAVITNSDFTSGAQSLAQSVRCVLINGSQIPDLIEGRISV